MLNCEITAEYYRNEIREKEVDLEKVFEYIVQVNSSGLSYDDMKQFIYSKGLYISSETMQGVYRRFDKNKNNQVLLDMFIYELSPKQDDI